MKLDNVRLLCLGRDLLALNDKVGNFLKQNGSKKWVRTDLKGSHFSSKDTLWYKIKDSGYVKHELSKILPIKIKSCDLSAKVFGFRSYKQELVGTKTNDYLYSKLETNTKKGYHGHVFMIYSPKKDGYISFCEEDLEFCIPDFDNYTPPKDRTFKVGSLVKPKNEKVIRGYNGVKTDNKYSVCKVVDYCPYTKKPNIVEVMDKDMNKVKVRTKHFKVI